MKKILIFTLSSLVCSIALSQVRFVEAPYPGSIPAPPSFTPVQIPPGMAPTQRPVTLPIAMQPGFEVTKADGNLRRALVRWTKMIGWTFEPEHWTLDRDIPIAGTANLGSDFKTAARSLLSSTEMTDLPAQPCFYSNRVLRVIALNELCSRQQAPKTQ